MSVVNRPGQQTSLPGHRVCFRASAQGRRWGFRRRL